MKKSRLKNKIVLFMIGATSVSLLGVGFSTWIVSIDKPIANITANVEMQDFKMETLIVTANTNVKSIIIGPKLSTSSTGDLIDITGDATQTNMDVPSTVDVLVDEDFVDNITETLTLSMDVTAGKAQNTMQKRNILKANDTTADPNIVTAINGDLFRRKAGTSYKYLELNMTETTFKKSDFAAYDNTSLQRFKKLQINLSDGDKRLGFNFGDYFKLEGETSASDRGPETFYQYYLNQYKQDYLAQTTYEGKVEKREIYLRALDQARTELTALSDIYRGANIKISFKANLIKK